MWLSLTGELCQSESSLRNWEIGKLSLFWGEAELEGRHDREPALWGFMREQQQLRVGKMAGGEKTEHTGTIPAGPETRRERRRFRAGLGLLGPGSYALKFHMYPRTKALSLRQTRWVSALLTR